MEREQRNEIRKMEGAAGGTCHSAFPYGDRMHAAFGGYPESAGNGEGGR